MASEAEMLKTLEQAFEEAWEIVNSEDGWKEEHKEKGKTSVNFWWKTCQTDFVLFYNFL